MGYVRVDSMAKARAKARAKVSKREIKKMDGGGALLLCRVCGRCQNVSLAVALQTDLRTNRQEVMETEKKKRQTHSE